eukprot:tig00021348_g20524.t1
MRTDGNEEETTDVHGAPQPRHGGFEDRPPLLLHVLRMCICAHLRRKIETPEELEDVVKSIVAARENVGKDAVDASGLRSFVEEHLTAQERASFFGDVLPAIQRAAHELPSLPRFRVLEADGQVFFSNRECAGLAAAKLRCFANYLRRALLGPPTAPRHVVVQRRRLAREPRWDLSATPLAGVRPAFRLRGAIEEAAPGVLQVDFANMYIGGGVLSTGCVQEEIRFALSPECLVSMLVCPVMQDDEAILISGTERYSDYKGYAFNLEFAGNHVDPTPMDERGNLRSYIVAIDAMDWRRGGAWRQYRPECMRRELRKALAGFLPWPDVPPLDAAAPIATGHWGCGAFLGDRELKFLLQAMAAAEAGRELHYYAFGETAFVAGAELVWGLACARLRTVGALWRALLSYSELRDGAFRAAAGARGGGGGGAGGGGGGRGEPPGLFAYLSETLGEPAP